MDYQWRDVGWYFSPFPYFLQAYVVTELNFADGPEERVIAKPARGAVENWILKNGAGGWTHPIHIRISHQSPQDNDGVTDLLFEQILLISRSQSAPAEHETPSYLTRRLL